VSKPKAAKVGRLSYNEQREYDRMEAVILEAESELADAQTAVEEAAGDADTQVLLAATQRLQLAQDKVERFYARWTELEAKITETGKG
jgi:ATP-binding cassette subfamily F protein uup